MYEFPSESPSVVAPPRPDGPLVLCVGLLDVDEEESTPLLIGLLTERDQEGDEGPNRGSGMRPCDDPDSLRSRMVKEREETGVAQMGEGRDGSEGNVRGEEGPLRNWTGTCTVEFGLNGYAGKGGKEDVTDAKLVQSGFLLVRENVRTLVD
uniref:Uncharacterized protein n=1 Tax=Chromera velia CCMP2878 TaxID=1169474 RepID=A0A0G4H765_9ALVE|eukprot:Cvel_24938.t1-p1 / transcript=Cvel_24938.t1 / gene=Cvel_24938 / organism=Chromera_velia_CCMP2878 / gene_product=hypothetical protein / transcript_product=hypothetical protein / location=Cvel_scaffold2759:14604-16251(-) / protein_length=150 / sequence_SO=supercontig / SO=protein_coding / is_pseudo=false